MLKSRFVLMMILVNSSCYLSNRSALTAHLFMQLENIVNTHNKSIFFHTVQIRTCNVSFKLDQIRSGGFCEVSTVCKNTT